MTSIASKVLSTNSRYVGIDMDVITDELRDYMDKATLIIAKGMANWEALSERHDEVKPLVYMLRTKCWPVADSMGAPGDANIVKIYE